MHFSLAITWVLRNAFYFVATTNTTTNIGANFSETAQPFLQFVYLVFAFVFVLFLAVFGTRLLAGVKNMRRGGNLSVLEAVGVGFQGTVQLVKVGEKYLVIGVTKERVSLLCEVESNLLTISPEQADNQIRFEKYLTRFLQKPQNKTHENEDEK